MITVVAILTVSNTDKVKVQMGQFAIEIDYINSLKYNVRIAYIY